MSWLVPALFFGFLLSVAWLDPRRIPPHSELGRTMKRAGGRARGDVRKALRDGRAVANPGLAALAAAVAQEEMNRIDYRGPLRKQEVLMLFAGTAQVALAVAVGLSHLGVAFSDIGGSLIVVFWVVVLRRLTPSHRHPTDRLLTAYHANLLLADQSGPGELDRIRLGMP
jgi:hypothetical protein